MKKLLCCFGIVLGILMIIVGIYILFKVYFVMQIHNGDLYDGFGTPYNYNKPSSPYTLFGVIGLFGGTSLSSYCYKRIMYKGD